MSDTSTHRNNMQGQSSAPQGEAAKTRDDGGPAMPSPINKPCECGASMEAQGFAGGMSLRDHFAGLAMQAEMITTFSDATPEAAADFQDAMQAAGRNALQHLAHNAYAVADAMLAARGGQ